MVEELMDLVPQVALTHIDYVPIVGHIGLLDVVESRM